MTRLARSAPEKPGRAARDDLGFHVGRQRHLAHVHFEDLFAADHVRVRHHDLAVETAGPEQCRVEHVRPVGGGDQDHAFIGLETVHLDQKLVEGLFALVIAAAETGAAMTADRVDFVDEDDAGRVLLGLLEHVAHAARADADEHLDEVGTGNGEERHIGFAGDRTGQQRLTGARRADQQRALGDAPAEPLEFVGVFQEFDDLFDVFLGLVDAGHVVERDAAMAFGQKLGLGLAEAHGLAAAGLHLAHEEDPHRDQEQHGEPRDEHADQRRHPVLRRLDVDLDTLLMEAVDQVRVLGQVGEEPLSALELAGDLLAGNGHFLNISVVDLREQPGIADLVGGAALCRALEQVEQRYEQQRYDHPDGEISEVVHLEPVLSQSKRNAATTRAQVADPQYFLTHPIK